MKRIFWIGNLICWCVFPVIGFAQSVTPPVIEKNRRNQEDGLEQTRKSSEDSESKAVFVKRGALSVKKKISRAQKKLLQPSNADSNRYASFLKNPNTGLIKIFPDIGCEDNGNVVRADEDCLKTIPMSAFYSFREQNYTPDFLSDIRLKNDVLISDGLLTQGVLTTLGDISLEDVSLASAGLKFINEFKPETHSREALNQTKQLIKGIKADGYIYRKALPAVENTTYALRVVAYRGSFIQTFRGAFRYAGRRRAR